MECSKCPFWFFLLVLLFGIGMYSFTAGFFLSRIELPISSSCGDFGNKNFEGCWFPRRGRFSKMLLLVIDGWRYDFAAQREGIDLVPAYSNKVRSDRM
jgi:predicted AlkP superfamily pyrophosphatase or phosphodiesterase